MVRFTLVVGFIFSVFFVKAQEYRVSENPLSEITTYKVLADEDTLIHYAIKPLWLKESYIHAFEKELINGGERKKKKRFVGRKLFEEHFFHLKGDKYNIMIDPLMDIGGGRDLEASETKNLTTNIRGIQLSGNITNKLSFYSSYYESQSFFPAYLDSIVRSKLSVPGFGRTKSFNNTGFDYNLVTGIFRFNASEHIQFTFGQDKLFFGHGYRSVLLSDNSFSYPFLGIHVKALKNKIHYSTNLVWLQELDRVPQTNDAEPLLIRKQANFHYLSFKPKKFLEVGIFEGVTWRRWDENEGSVDVNGAFYSPLIFTSELVNPDESEFHKVNGLNIMVSPFSKFQLYGQYAFNANSSAQQAGFKWNAPLGLNAWYVQGEYNNVGEEVYSTNEFNHINYDHYRQGIATPVDNYNELIGIIRFHKNYWWAEGKINIQEQEKLNNVTESVQLLQGELGYILNPKYNLMLYAGGIIRNSDLSDDTFWGFAGIKTSLINRYFDF